MGQVRKPRPKPAVVTLKMVAQQVGLTPGTVSAVLNDAPSAHSIPQSTKNRIHAAAKALDYRPNFFARSLRNKRTYMIGVIAEEIGDSYGSLVIKGIEEHLRTMDYSFITAVHRHDEQLLSKYTQLSLQRGVEGLTLWLLEADFWPGVVESAFPGITSGLPVTRARPVRR